MNEQLQTALAEILSRATQGIDAGTQFLSAQLPDVIQQLLAWKMAVSAAGFVSSIILVLGIVLLWVRVVQWVKSRDWTDYPHVFIPLGFGSFVGMIVALTIQNLDWLQIWLAPKIYLIEYAASLAK